MGQLLLKSVNARVQRVLCADGRHVGNLKLIGNVWKFKAIGYDGDGAMEPGGGPLTDQHNMVFAQADVAELNVRLGIHLR